MPLLCYTAGDCLDSGILVDSYSEQGPLSNFRLHSQHTCHNSFLIVRIIFRFRAAFDSHRIPRIAMSNSFTDIYLQHGVAYL